LLVDLFALFEGWLAKTLGDMGQAYLHKHFQFPTEYSKGVPSKGAGWAIAKLKNSSSAMLKDAFYGGLCTHPKNSIKTLEGLLTCYRCFKECRNTGMHNGGVADKKAEEA